MRDGYPIRPFLIHLSTPKCGQNLDAEGNFEGERGEGVEGRHERQGMQREGGVMTRYWGGFFGG